jgi:ABC-type amino acid transport substrate-binding protein
MNKKAAVVFGAVAILLLAGIVALTTIGSEDTPPGTLTAECFTIVDGTGSGTQFNAAKRLDDDLRTFLRDKKCGRASFVPLTGASLPSVCASKAVDLDPDLGDVDQAELRSVRRDLALQKAKEVLKCAQDNRGKGSDVLGALSRAAGEHRVGQGVYEGLVVSDMIHRDDRVDLKSADLSTPEKRATIIQEFTGANLIPNLSGVSLDIVALGVTLSSTEQAIALKKFWDELFASRAAGSPVIAGHRAQG